MEDSNTWKTSRQLLMDTLIKFKEIHDLKSLMTELEYPDKKNLIQDIESIARTLKNEGYILEVYPPTCQSCGFEFKQKKHKLKIPSKCPKCKAQRINWPRIRLRKK